MPVAVQKMSAPTVRETSDDGYAPSFRCDECGKEIPKPARGRVAWDPDENRTYLPVSFLHAGCVDAYADRVDKDLRVADLSDYLDSLDRFFTDGGS